MQDTERCWNWKNETLDIAGTLAARGWSYNGYPVSADYFGSYSLLGQIDPKRPKTLRIMSGMHRQVPIFVVSGGGPRYEGMSARITKYKFSR